MVLGKGHQRSVWLINEEDNMVGEIDGKRGLITRGAIILSQNELNELSLIANQLKEETDGSN